MQLNNERIQLTNTVKHSYGDDPRHG